MKARLAGYAEKTHRRKIPLRRHWVDTEEHFFFFLRIIFICTFIYLAVARLSCGMWDLAP